MTDRKLVVDPSQYLINTVWRLPAILDRGRRFLDMFKPLRPTYCHAFYSHDHSRSIKTNVRQSCALFLHFILSTCESTNKAFKDMYTSAATIYYIVHSSNQVRENAQRPLWNLFCQYCCSQSLRPVARSYEIPRDWSYTGRNMGALRIEL